MSPTSVLLFLLQLCCLQMMLVSMPTCKLPGKMVRHTHDLLEDMGPRLPTQCHQLSSDIHLPDSVLSDASTKHSKCRWSSLVVYECLREANLIFMEYDLPEEEGGLTWSEQKLENYQNLQYRLVEEHQCVSIRTSTDWTQANQTWDSVSPISNWGFYLQLNTTEASAVLSPFFRNVTAVVEQQVSKRLVSRVHHGSGDYLEPNFN
uniref:Uncharacterized protein n=1 Tax=Poecilia reticulata TaxID=8081 RepID=A0A3P9P8H7_POERE